MVIASTITYTRPLDGIKVLPLNMDRGLTPTSYSLACLGMLQSQAWMQI